MRPPPRSPMGSAVPGWPPRRVRSGSGASSAPPTRALAASQLGGIRPGAASNTLKTLAIIRLSRSRPRVHPPPRHRGSQSTRARAEIGCEGAPMRLAAEVWGRRFPRSRSLEWPVLGSPVAIGLAPRPIARGAAHVVDRDQTTIAQRPRGCTESAQCLLYSPVCGPCRFKSWLEPWRHRGSRPATPAPSR